MTVNDGLDVGFDLEITKVTRQAAGAGTWICGTLSGHRFEALVFPVHAVDPDWEIGNSRISMLFIRRLADRQVVFNWDRGADVPAADALTGAIADFLAGMRGCGIYATPLTGWRCARQSGWRASEGGRFGWSTSGREASLC